jgi:hypothetical protein
MFPANTYVIRRANDRDDAAMRRLAAIDRRGPLSGDVLVAEKDGDLAAAISLDHGDSLSDRVQRIPDAEALLRVRAGALRAAERTPSLPRRLLAGVRVPRLSPAHAI